MRELKFRAWNGRDKQMWYSNSHCAINFWGENRWQVQDDMGVIRVYEDNGRGIIMQYTGLHDKNGKEIYEGDIVETKILSLVGKPAEISYFEDRAMFGWACYRYEDGKKIGGTFGDFGDLMEEDFWPVIIGNIYENPELLK